MASHPSLLAMEQVPDASAQVPWSQYFFQTFYHMSIIPLLSLTIVLAWLARPSTREELPSGFRKHQAIYLFSWIIAVAADWLQGPYVYKLYASYGFTGPEIAQLFVAGFGASLAFGCVVGPMADRFGRKRMCLTYCVLYIVSCCTKHFKSYPVLMLGRVTGGIATSILFSCFEAWMVSEHLFRQKFSDGLLSYMFGLMYSTMYSAAILSGLIAQAAADSFTLQPIAANSVIYVGGYCAPFDLAIVCLVVAIGLIAYFWQENYGLSTEGNDQPALEKLKSGLQLMTKDRNVLLVCIIVACFEGSMYAFVFNWTPALESKSIPPPHGVIFAIFMMCCMCGASSTTITGNLLKPTFSLLMVFTLGICAFGLTSITAGSQEHLMLCFWAFLLFEFCCGIYFPSVGMLKSTVVPENVRGTVYNIYRVPLNAVVVILLLSDITMVRCFLLCGVLLTVGLVAVGMIHTNPPNEKGEASPISKSA